MKALSETCWFFILGLNFNLCGFVSFAQQPHKSDKIFWAKAGCNSAEIMNHLINSVLFLICVF